MSYVGLAMSEDAWVAYLDMAAGAVLTAGLAYLLGWRHQSWAAGALIAYVLLVSALRILGAGRPPALLFVAIFLWLFYEGFQAAREYAALKDVHLEASTPTA